MYAALTLLLLAAAPDAAPAPAPAAGEAALLKTFREEFVAITPGSEKFPAKLEIVDGKRTRTLVAPPAYLIAKYEVPQNLWEAVMGSNPSKWKGPRNSVEMLSFDEAEDFCKRATEKMRAAKLIEPTQTVRLPTDAEWEYAARAGTTTRFSFGDDVKLIDAYAWHTGNAAGNDPPVGAKKPNAWDLYDVHGYLWEWCTAAADSKPEAAAKEQSLRGGSWKDTPEKLATAYRRLEKPELRDDAVGLRCVLTAPAAAAKRAE
jgi:formylglycine-generating enzyme required for sulfatase activity